MRKKKKGISKLEKFIYKLEEFMKKRISLLENELNTYNTNFEKDFIKKEIVIFKTGTATIYVGAPTKLERHEKIMRYIDALCAISSLENGIIPGSGIILEKIANELSLKTHGNNILKIALTEPMKQILNNAALDYDDILNNIKINNYEILYNVITNKYENVNNTKIIDSERVIINSLKNACSIASMLLTTNSLVINEYQNNFNKVNDFNNL